MTSSPVQAAIDAAKAAAANVTAAPPIPPVSSLPFVPPVGWLPHPSAPGYYYKGDEAITEAELKARTTVIPPTVPNVPQAYVPAASTVSSTNTAGTAVATYDQQQYKPGRKLSMAEMNAGRSKLNVDNFLKVNENGIKASFLRDDPRSITLGNKLGSKLKIRMNFEHDVRFCFALRYMKDPIGKEVVYNRTADRVVADDGTPWATCLAVAMNCDKTCKGDYPSVDISGDLVEPFLALDGSVIIAAGARIGFSTAVMNWKAFDRFLSDMLKNGMVQANTVGDETIYSGEFYVTIGYLPVSNKNNQQYGNYTFEYAGAIDGAESNAPAPVVSAPPAPAPVVSAPPASPSAAPEATVAERPKRARKAAEAPAAPSAPALDGEVLPPIISAAPPLPPAAPPLPPKISAAPPLPPKAFPPEGWTAHPDAPGYYYKGEEVLLEADLRARS